MARGKAEFTQMQPFSTDIRKDLPDNLGEHVKVDMKEEMAVEKAFTNMNFAVEMGARNAARLRKFQNKPVAPRMPVQGSQPLQGSPGMQRVMTPPKQPIGGRKPNTPKTKGFGKEALKYVGVPAIVGFGTADIANRVQERRMKNDKKTKSHRKGFLMDKLEGD